MNRHDRRRQAAINRGREDRRYNEYIRHLPQVPIDAPLERGRVYHTVMFHDHDCPIYTGQACTCAPLISRHVEPTRS